MPAKLQLLPACRHAGHRGRAGALPKRKGRSAAAQAPVAIKLLDGHCGAATGRRQLLRLCRREPDAVFSVGPGRRFGRVAACAAPGGACSASTSTCSRTTRASPELNTLSTACSGRRRSARLSHRARHSNGDPSGRIRDEAAATDLGSADSDGGSGRNARTRKGASAVRGFLSVCWWLGPPQQAARLSIPCRSNDRV